MDITEEGIVICVNDEHPLKAWSPIEVTWEGLSNAIWFNVGHLLRTPFPIEINEERILNDEYPLKAWL